MRFSAINWFEAFWKRFEIYSSKSSFSSILTPSRVCCYNNFTIYLEFMILFTIIAVLEKCGLKFYRINGHDYYFS